MYLFYYLSFLLIFNPIKADDINYVKQLRNKFLKSSNYYRLNRPVRQQNKTIQIAYGLIITQILELDLKRQILTTDAILHLKWMDDYIKWDPKKFGNVSKIRFSSDEIWRPEIEIWNEGFDLFAREKYASYSEMIALYNGSIYWVTPMTIFSQCPLELKSYPFDTQECDLYLGIKDYKAKEAVFINSDKETVIGPWAPNTEYRIINISSETKIEDFDKNLNFSTVQILIKFKRRLTNYLYFVTLPHLFSILFCLFMFNFQIYSGIRALFTIISILLDLKIIYIISYQIGLKSYGTPDIVKDVGLNLAIVAILFLFSVFIRQKISFLYSKIVFFKNIENSFITKLFLVRSSNLIEDDLIKMIKNDQYTKIIQIDRFALNRFSILIQLIDRILILIYCLFILKNLNSILLIQFFNQIQ